MNSIHIAFKLVMTIYFCLLAPGCTSEQEIKESQPIAKISWPCLNPPAVKYHIPGDTVLSDQASFNCFAWQEFIALNWPSDVAQPASAFGEPGDYAPVIFETYKNVHAFLNAKGSKPAGWGKKSDNISIVNSTKPDARIMLRTSKFSADFDNDDIEEAFPFKPAGEAWLADKKGNLVWYEVLVNKDEFDYFYTNEFYNSTQQYQAALKGKHIDLPKGDLNGNVGAIEMKAAWLSVDDPSAEKWKRYKMANAVFCTSDKNCSESAVALVGLHIIHKTASQPTWVWSTFEHIDNAPDINQVNNNSPSNNYNFYSADCKERDIPAQCVNGKSGLKTSCIRNTHPAYSLTLKGGHAQGACLPYPIQVVREFPLPNTNENPIRSINEAAQLTIQQANSDSVYQYYQLINVLWNDSTVDENRAKPLPLNSLSETAFRPDPNAFPVANTVLETYIQNTTCIECHSNARIAATSEQPNPSFVSDYSFIFSLAGPKAKTTQ